VLNPNAPWHMWGNTVLVPIPLVAPAGPRVVGSVDNVQVARVNYKRPETWSFFFAGEIVSGVPSDVARTIIATMNVAIGIGRSVYRTEPRPPGNPGSGAPFVQFLWTIGVGEDPCTRNQNKRWTTSVTSPPLDDVVSDTHQIDWLPAESIQCSCYAQCTVAGASALDNSVTVAVTGFFAPRTHVRPDWYSEEYRGDETRGT
jgi:hypothetical protein